MQRIYCRENAGRAREKLALTITTLLAPPTTLASPETPKIHWIYADETGPDHWADLDSSFATCGSGQSQSPIDLTAAAEADLVNIEFHYQPVPLNLLNNGHTVQVPYAPGSYILLAGNSSLQRLRQRYDLRQFHFHSPSEHAINGEPQLADQANEGNAYADLSANLPEKIGDKVRTEKTINAETLLPKETTTYRYSGSLTTPPCSESVTWLVMSQPVSLPGEQLSRYEKLLNYNNRPLHLLNKRSIQIDNTP